MHSVHNASLRLRHLSSFRPIVAQYRAKSQPHSRRCIHYLRQLPYDVDQGLGDFLSPAALRMIAVDYQKGLLTRLNEQVKGTQMEGLSVTDTVISTASHQRHALAFNYASQALNNSFFLDCLRPPPPPPQTNEDYVQNNLMGEIRIHFGSLAQLKSTFSAAALGMVNSGWVWLVSDEQGHMEVVATFGAGTLLVRSRTHMGTSELPILGESADSRYKGLTPPKAKRSPKQNVAASQPAYSSSYGTSSASGPSGYPSSLSPSTPSSLHTNSPTIFNDAPLTPTGQANKMDNEKEVGDILTPLLCLSVHEHAWVGAGYGVWGKEEYLKRFWTVVNWERVDRGLKMARSFG